MGRKRQVDPTWTPEDHAASRTYRTKKATGQLSSQAAGAQEARAERLARGKAAIDAVMVAGEKSLNAQAKARKAAEAELLGKAAKITDEEIVELLFEHFPISATQALERLARFDANKLRKQIVAS